MAAVKLLVELIVGITELFEAVLPKPHVLKIAERFLIRFDPIRAKIKFKFKRKSDGLARPSARESNKIGSIGKTIADYLIKAIIRRKRATNVSPPPKTTASIEENESGD